MPSDVENDATPQLLDFDADGNETPQFDAEIGNENNLVLSEEEESDREENNPEIGEYWSVKNEQNLFVIIENSNPLKVKYFKPTVPTTVKGGKHRLDDYVYDVLAVVHKGQADILIDHLNQTNDTGTMKFTLKGEIAIAIEKMSNREEGVIDKRSRIFTGEKLKKDFISCLSLFFFPVSYFYFFQFFFLCFLQDYGHTS